MREFRSDLSKGTLTFHVLHTPSITINPNQEAGYILRQVYRKGERLVAFHRPTREDLDLPDGPPDDAILGLELTHIQPNGGQAQRRPVDAEPPIRTRDVPRLSVDVDRDFEIILGKKVLSSRIGEGKYFPIIRQGLLKNEPIRSIQS